MLASKLNPDSSEEPLPQLSVSYKPQEIVFKPEQAQMTVRQLFYKRICSAYLDPLFVSDVIKPLQLESFIDQSIDTLSGGEIQRVAVALCLGTPADLYLLDEPSASLDVEQRLAVCKVIKRFIRHNKKTAFIVEHDLTMAVYLADKVIVFTGKPSLLGIASAPTTMETGVNLFMQQLGLTLRTDSKSHRPRINKPEGRQDREQKKEGNMFLRS